VTEAFKGQEPGAPPPHPQYGPPEAVYTYRDAEGRPLYYVCRFVTPPTEDSGPPGKTFLQGRRTAEGWRWNLRGVEPVLYRWPEVAAHLGAGSPDPLYICEGEKDCDRLRAYLAEHGLPGTCTTNPMGAGKWREEYTEALTGARHVVIVADNDEPGRAHALQVARELRPYCDRVEARLPALDDEKADLSEHLEAGLGLDELLPLEEPPEAAAGEHEPFEGLDLDSFLSAPPPEPDWDWEGWYARGDLVLVTGDPGVGKSLVLLAAAVTASGGGGELLGEGIAARRALYLDLENPDDEVYRRLWAFGLRGARDGFAYAHRPPSLDLREPECIQRLRATIMAADASLVVIDSLRRAAPGLDENDSREVGRLLSALRELAAELRCTFVVIHHPRKPVGDAPVDALHAARGSGDLTGSADSYLFFRRLKGGLIRIEHGKARRGREHEHVAFRVVSGEGGEPVIEPVPLETGQEDDELYEAVVSWVREHPGEPQGAVEEAMTAGRVRVRAALRRGASTFSLALGPGRARNGKYWFPVGHAALGSPGEHGASGGDQPLTGLEEAPLAPLAPPLKGGEPGEQAAGLAPAELEAQPERLPDENGDVEW
jgi:hypothetical protein